MLQDRVAFLNIGATTAAFTLMGGRYMFSGVATWGGGHINLQRLAADGSTFVDIYAAFDASGAEQNEPINTLTANSALLIDLSPGTYQIAVTTASAIYAEVARVPLD